MGVCIGTGKNGISEIIEKKPETGYVKKTTFSDGIGIYGRTGFVFRLAGNGFQNEGSMIMKKKNKKVHKK